MQGLPSWCDRAQRRAAGTSTCTFWRRGHHGDCGYPMSVEVDAMDCSERNLVWTRSFPSPFIEGPQSAEVDDVFFGAAQDERRYSAASLRVVGENRSGLGSHGRAFHRGHGARVHPSRLAKLPSIRN